MITQPLKSRHGTDNKIWPKDIALIHTVGPTVWGWGQEMPPHQMYKSLFPKNPTKVILNLRLRVVGDSTHKDLSNSVFKVCSDVCNLFVFSNKEYRLIC